MLAFIAALSQQQSQLSQLAQQLTQPLPDDDDDTAASTARRANQLPPPSSSSLLLLDVPPPPPPPPPHALAVAVDECAVREALRLNGEYRAVLAAHVQRVDEQLHAVHAKRRELQAAVARQNRTNAKRVAAVTDPRAPGGAYFVDPHGSEPSPNADALKKRRRADSGALLLESKYQTRPWKQRDRDVLARAVRSQTRERLTVLLQAEFGARPPSDLRLVAAKLRELVALSDAELDRAVDADAIDWLTVARAFEPERRAIDCHVQWINRQSPTINTAPFDAAEKTRLRALAAQYNGANWPAIAAALGTSRRPWQCFQALQQDEQQTFKGKPWSADEDERLRALVERFGTDWLRVASGLAARTPAQCLHRWQKSRDPTIRRAKWQPDEDVQLRIATEAYGRGNWALIARHVHGRTDVQCRERYVNVLDPLVNNEPFTPDEDARLLALADEHDCSWTKVAQHMPGRTDGACWRRWRLLVPADQLETYLASRKRAWSAVPVSRNEPTARGVFKREHTPRQHRRRRRRTSNATQDSESLRNDGDDDDDDHQDDDQDDDLGDDDE